jgi:hypothetical protein
MINEGVSAAKTWPDQWTAVTKDGKRSAQFEHTLVITETGCQILTARDQSKVLTALKWEDEPDGFERPAKSPLAASPSASSSAAEGGSSSSSTSAAAASAASLGTD